MGIAGDAERDNLVSDFYPAFKLDAPVKRKPTMTPKVIILLFSMSQTKIEIPALSCACTSVFGVSTQKARCVEDYLGRSMSQIRLLTTAILCHLQSPYEYPSFPLVMQKARASKRSGKADENFGSGKENEPSSKKLCTSPLTSPRPVLGDVNTRSVPLLYPLAGRDMPTGDEQ